MKILRFYRNSNMVYVLFLLMLLACEVSDDGEEIFLSIPVYNEMEDSVPRQYSKVCNLLIDETNLIETVLYDTTYIVTTGFDITMILYQTKDDLPVCIFVAIVDLINSDLTIGASMPDNGTDFKRQKLTVQAQYAENSGVTVWGGINGDFFNTSDGTPMGIVYKSGEAIKPTFGVKGIGWFAISNNHKAFIGKENEFERHKSKVRDAISGYNIVVDNGKAVINNSNEAYPRTSIGVSKDSTTVYMIAVDGKRKNYSNGISLHDLGKVMHVLGAYNAINLDGGGSTTLIVRNTTDATDNLFKVVNYPSDREGERPVANGLLIIEK